MKPNARTRDAISFCALLFAGAAGRRESRTARAAQLLATGALAPAVREVRCARRARAPTQQLRRTAAKRTNTCAPVRSSRASRSSKWSTCTGTGARPTCRRLCAPRRAAAAAARLQWPAPREREPHPSAGCASVGRWPLRRHRRLAAHEPPAAAQRAACRAARPARGRAVRVYERALGAHAAHVNHTGVCRRAGRRALDGCTDVVQQALAAYAQLLPRGTPQSRGASTGARVRRAGGARVERRAARLADRCLLVRRRAL